ncbi:MAG TPA: 3'-5' exonuclease [Casimicrobiaceae bacterium]|nr:3'-5' exonuclease [Casimicrobiaceae bacterium]
MIWKRLFGAGERGDGGAARWIVIDTETTGLDVARDALLAVGGVAVGPDGVRPDDSFEVLLRNEAGSSHENIVVHGIGRQAQAGGVPVEEAMRAFAAWAGDAPAAGFHVPFDRAVLARAARAAGVALPDRPWLDLAPLAAALTPPDPKKPPPGLDDWLALYGIDCAVRHHAAGDALATAELLLRLRALARREGARDFAGLVRLAKHQRWLSVAPGGAP